MQEDLVGQNFPEWIVVPAGHQTELTKHWKEWLKVCKLQLKSQGEDHHRIVADMQAKRRSVVAMPGSGHKRAGASVTWRKHGVACFPASEVQRLP